MTYFRLGLLFALLSAWPISTTNADSPCRDRYVDVRGVHMFYRVCGKGPPLVLFHGAAMVAEGWAPQIATFRKSHTVYIPERRGVGRTADIDGDWTYRGMTDDMAAFMDKLKIRHAAVVGLSDGGNIALILASMRPDLVRALVVSGANYDVAGLGAFKDEVEKMTPDELIASAPPQVQPWIAIHRRVSPDKGVGLARSFAKMKRMWFDFAISDGELKKISALTLVTAGDDDMFSVPYTVSLWQKVPKAKLMIAPDATHFWLEEKPNLANQVIGDFLASAP